MAIYKDKEFSSNMKDFVYIITLIEPAKPLYNAQIGGSFFV